MDLTDWIDGPGDSEEPAAETPEGGGPPAPEEPSEAPERKAELPWCEKYRPRTLDEVVGNEASVQAARRWAEQWSGGKPKSKALLIYGRVGTGKTSIASALAADCGWEVLEMNASDKRNRDLVEQIAGVGSQTRSFSGRRKLILVEEIEGLSGVADRGASKALIGVIKETSTPLILTCNDIKNKKLGNLKRYCEKVPLKKVAPGAIVKRLGQILEEEGVKVDSIKVLQRIADNADGDMRSAINDLQAVAQGEEVVEEGSVFLEQRDRPIDVYKAMQRIFRCKDYSACRRVLWDLDEEPRNFVAWLDENIPVEYREKGERGRAFHQLSRADIFLGRVTNRQYWGFLRYVNDLMTVGVGFAREKPNFGFSKYKFPSLIWKMGSTKARRAKERAIAAKMSPVVHDSGKGIVLTYLPLMRRVVERDRQAGLRMLRGFELEEDELEHFYS